VKRVHTCKGVLKFKRREKVLHTIKQRRNFWAKTEISSRINGVRNEVSPYSEVLVFPGGGIGKLDRIELPQQGPWQL